MEGLKGEEAKAPVQLRVHDDACRRPAAVLRDGRLPYVVLVPSPFISLDGALYHCLLQAPFVLFYEVPLRLFHQPCEPPTVDWRPFVAVSFFLVTYDWSKDFFDGSWLSERALGRA